MTDAITNPSSPKPLLELRDIGVHFSKASGTFFKPSWVIKAVDGVSLQIAEGTTLGLVGESGCGKTTLGRTIVGLIPPHSGTIHFKGLDITNPSWGSSRRLRREMQIVFQDATGSLDPRLPVGRSIAEPLDVFSVGSPRERRDRVRALLNQVGLRAADADRYPHELSGGQRQRVGIARALALNPKLLVLDEPVSALDVSVQAQIINLLTDLQQSQGLTYLFIGHDLALIEYVSDQIVVMHEGLIVETGPAHEICQHPQHPYTQGLLSSTLHLPTRDHDPHQRVNNT